MCGIRNGVAAQITSEEPCSIFIHCYGHVLNLAAGETVKSRPVATFLKGGSRIKGGASRRRKLLLINY